MLHPPLPLLVIDRYLAIDCCLVIGRYSGIHIAQTRPHGREDLSLVHANECLVGKTKVVCSYASRED